MAADCGSSSSAYRSDSRGAFARLFCEQELAPLLGHLEPHPKKGAINENDDLMRMRGNADWQIEMNQTDQAADRKNETSADDVTCK
jgi:hypothetical protein